MASLRSVEVQETDLSRPLLGLSEPANWCIAANVTHVIHNAFPVTFKRGVASFESQFKIMSHLLQLARDNGASPRMVFVSSIAAVSQYTSKEDLDGLVAVSEEPFRPDWKPPAMGYWQAKLICEKMLEQAVQEGGVDGVIARSALCLGFLSYFPLAESRLVLHVENPSRQFWASAMATISEALTLPILSYKDWLARVRDLAEDEEHVATLHSFFEKDFSHVGSGKLYLNTTETKRASPTLRECGIIRDDILRRYVSRTLLSR
ncbi:hypothetical protein BDV96DRAFT_650519 [Lophiotrema nucula]|uniref:Thioester reductase (TE) domain-containing protein n=1 Tax=Lophiotrema nucula TaxID=690887 RepID=A0A6A5YUU1_9PLEO|nr:hypothetical protein BDV96DRAFT_650519 [Lophiotrema nucula]